MSEKKVGIITMHRPWNYGSILQTYALQVTTCTYGVHSKQSHILVSSHSKVDTGSTVLGHTSTVEQPREG